MGEEVAVAVSPSRRASTRDQSRAPARKLARRVSGAAPQTARRKQGAYQPDDEYLVALAKQDATHATDKLVRRYHGFVRLKASSYFLIGGDSDDLIQEGLVGLFKAIRDYRPERESSFRNFAELCITRQIITAVKTATRNKHTPLNSYVSFSQTPAAGGEEGEPTMADVLPGFDRPRSRQPGDLHRGDPEPGRVHHERAQRPREQRPVALSGRALL